MARIVFCGVGALGSTAAVLCRNVDAELRFIDFDRVESKNLLAQAYVKQSIGKNKAESLKLQLANSYREVKEYKESNRWLTQLVGKLDTPNENGIILELLAGNHERLGDRERAVELWQEIVRLHPTSSASTVARAALQGLKVTKKP